MDISRIRNFSIIAHIDHGKSTLADRMLEITGTVEHRKMRDQVLDNMDLERERGITIKMQPVRMLFKSSDGSECMLNLIDTPGHIDFSYEVSRALKAVEGTLLLIDSTQGVQAQTLTTLQMAQGLGLTIIPVLSKIDSPLARVPEVTAEIVRLLGCREEDIVLCSGKTGEGVPALLERIVTGIPAPTFEHEKDFRSLIFDFAYSTHRGIIVYVRVFDGAVTKGDRLKFGSSGKTFAALEVGMFTPEEKAVDVLEKGQIGYIVTGIKEAGIASVGDTLLREKSTLPTFSGYMQPSPVVWASVYPESQDDFNELKLSLERLRLSDSSLSYEEESSGVLGKGFRCGFLGMLHLEIITERLRREFTLDVTVTTPSITYEVENKNGERKLIYSPIHFPDDGSVVKVFEPWVACKIITPANYVSPLMQILYDHEAVLGDSETFGDLPAPSGTRQAGVRTMFMVDMPLRELMRNFFGKMKTVSSGFASLSYTIEGMRDADVVRLDVLVAEEPVPAFAKVVSRRRVEEEAERVVEKLYDILPRQLFVTKIQAKAMGRILSARKLPALKKDVTGYLYGGDITRKRKLWEKQKKGKKRMLARGKVNIPHDVFIKMIQSE